MKRSEKILIGSVVVGAIAGFAMLIWLPGLPGWLDIAVAVMLCAGVYSSALRQQAQISVVDSKSING